jgi:hypothetical protein
MNIKGINKAEILSALYNNSRPLGLGFLQFDPAPMTVEEAQKYLDYADENYKGYAYFDYLKGRVMKIDLSKDVEEFSTGLYNRDNGENSAEKIIQKIIERSKV